MTIQVVKTMCPDITTLVHKQKSISQSLLGPNNVLNVLVYWLNSLLKKPPKKQTKKNKNKQNKKYRMEMTLCKKVWLTWTSLLR